MLPQLFPPESEDLTLDIRIEPFLSIQEERLVVRQMDPIDTSSKLLLHKLWQRHFRVFLRWKLFGERKLSSLVGAPRVRVAFNSQRARMPATGADPRDNFLHEHDYSLGSERALVLTGAQSQLATLVVSECQNVVVKVKC